MSIILKQLSVTALGCLACLLSLNTLAQKLPNKQEKSLAAPANVKVDGKANEWTFQAYNNATEVFYTVAHDAENVYLAIKATDEPIVRKIVSGGITFTISQQGKKTDAEGAAITYPLFNYKNKPNLKFSLKAVRADSVDYFVTSNNKKMAGQGKFFKVGGIKGIDSLVSVYNTDAISLAAAFDKDMSYTYELAIARKHIAHLVNSDGKISYNVTLNPLKMDDIPGITVKRNDSGAIMSIDFQQDNAFNNASRSMSNPTDFSGEYILSK